MTAWEDDEPIAWRLARWWPEASRRARVGLVRRGVPWDTVDEVLQETAARALETNPSVFAVDQLASWSFVVAWRVWLDMCRADRNRGPVDGLEGSAVVAAASEHDVVDIVAARLELQRALRGMVGLTPSDRDVLLRGVGGEAVAVPASRKVAVREAVQRHRARSRLVAAMARLGVVIGGIKAAWRHGRSAVTLPAVAMAAVMLPAMSLLLDHVVRDEARAALAEGAAGAEPAAFTVADATAGTTPSTVVAVEQAARGHAATPPASPPPTDAAPWIELHEVVPGNHTRVDQPRPEQWEPCETDIAFSGAAHITPTETMSVATATPINNTVGSGASLDCPYRKPTL